MAEGSLLTDKIMAFVGRTEEPNITKVEDGSIQRFAEAVGTSNPLCNDVAYAKNSKHGRLVAPPSFKGWPVKSSEKMELGAVGELMKAGAPTNLLDAGVIYEYFDVIKSGDTLVSFGKIDKIAEKTQKSGARMLVVTSMTTYTNQDGKVVLKEYHDLIMR